MSYSSSPITVQIVWHWPGTSYSSPPVAVQAVQRWPGINNSEIPPTSISQHSVASLTCKLRTASSSRCTDHQQYTAGSALPAAAAFNSLTTSGTLQSLHCPQQQQASSRHGRCSAHYAANVSAWHLAPAHSLCSANSLRTISHSEILYSWRSIYKAEWKLRGYLLHKQPTN